MAANTNAKSRSSAVTRLDALAKRVLSDAPGVSATEPPRRSSVLAKRHAKVQDALGGKIRSVKVRSIDPSRVKIWSAHDRDYAALSAERCTDLIDGFRRTGQQFPAIVRPIAGDPDHDVELVCGARRHWVAAYLNVDLQVEERRLSDLEAFSLMDAENRDREDISDHERACNYVRAVELFFDGNRSRLAAHLNIDQGNFSKLLRLTELPAEILNAYADRRGLLVHHGQFYARALADPAKRDRLLRGAVALRESGLPGRKVFATLRAALGSEAGDKTRPITALPGGTVGSLTWSLQTSGKKAEPSCEVRFARPSPGDTVALARLRGEFAALLERLDSQEPGE